MTAQKESGMAKNFRSIATIAFVLLAGQTVQASPPVGLIVYAEEWNPTKPNGEALKVLENNPTILSDTLNSAWGTFRNWYLATVPSMLHAPDYLYAESKGAVPKGITLYSRTHNINLPPEMTLPAQVDFTLVPEGANAFRANFQVPGSTISLCSTTPTVAGQYADPCVDLAVDVIFSLSLQISDVPGQIMNVTAANVSLSNFKYSQGNWSTDVALGISEIVNFLGGPDYQALLVNTIDSTNVSVKKDIQAKAINPLNVALGSYEQSALTAINQQLQPAASISRLIHLAVWAQNQQNSQTLNLLFAPPLNGVTIDPSRQTGQFSGTLTFDPSVKTVPACSTLNTSSQFTGQVQTGPRPIVAINSGNPVFGTAPVQALAVAFSGGTLQGRQCPYTLSHLAVGLPNILNFSSFAYHATGLPSMSTHLEIQPSQWSSPVVLAPNGTVIYAGTVTQTQPGFARTLVQTNATQIAPVPANPSPPSGIQPVAPSWSTAARPYVQTAANSPTANLPAANLPAANLQSLNLVASISVSVQTGAGALPQQGRIGQVSPGDPAVGQAKTAWGTTPQATSAVPAWAPATTVGAPSGVATGSSLQRSTTLNRATTLKMQQPAAPATAPSSLQNP
jgi:hypothetical protein